MLKYVFPVSTLPYTASAMRKLTNCNYFYLDYFTAVRIALDGVQQYSLLEVWSGNGGRMHVILNGEPLDG